MNLSYIEKIYILNNFSCAENKSISILHGKKEFRGIKKILVLFNGKCEN